MRQWVLMGVAATALAGCIPPGRPQAPGGPLPIEGDSIRYETGPWRFQVNASNLADKRHVTTCLARGDCFFGIGRTVLGSATYRF